MLLVVAAAGFLSSPPARAAAAAGTPPMGCGTVTTVGSSNAVPLVVDGFPCAAGGTAGAINNPEAAYVSLKICAPGSTSNCQIIDHVEVDTGSSGTRIAASALLPALQPGVAGGLAPVAGSRTASTLTECEVYVDTFIYGPIVAADIYIGNKLVKSGKLQVFGDSAYPVPAACSKQGGTAVQTTQAFGANGLIGVGFEPVDVALYYDCASGGGSCTSNTQFAGVPNLVTQFSADNNGVVIALPALPTSGAVTPVVGTLTFGISTQADNTPPSGTIAVPANGNPYSSLWGTFSAEVGGVWSLAYIDSGTPVVFFNDAADSALARCSPYGYFSYLYCPATPQSVAFNLGASGTTRTLGTITYAVGNALQIDGSGTVIAANDLAGPAIAQTTFGGAIGFGLSSFFGHSMYFLFAGMQAPGAGLGGTANGIVTGPINGIF